MIKRIILAFLSYLVFKYWIHISWVFLWFFQHTTSSMFLDPFYFSHFCSLFIGSMKFSWMFWGFLNFLRESSMWQWRGGVVLPLGCDSVQLHSRHTDGLLCVQGQNKGRAKCSSIPRVTLPSTVLWWDILPLFGGKKQTIENLCHLFNLNS